MPCTDPRRVSIATLRTSPPGSSRGAVLVVALILLLALTLIGITAARMQTAQEGMARNDDNHQLALQSAEAALREGEAVIALHSAGDFQADTGGLYNLGFELQATSSSVADTINWASPGSQSMQYAGATLSNVPTPPQPAQFIVESLPPVITPGGGLNHQSYGPPQASLVYRITAHAEGGDSSSNVTLQTIVSSIPAQ
jgi:type IV pilus assembly protein PilX